MRDLWWKTPFTLVLPSVSLYRRSSLIFISSFIDSVILAVNGVVKDNIRLSFLSFLTIQYGSSSLEITLSDMKDNFCVNRICLNPLRSNCENKQKGRYVLKFNNFIKLFNTLI